MSLGNVIQNNKNVLEKYSSEFLKLFGVSLSKYMHNIFGFDIVSFDAYVDYKYDGMPPGVSMRDFLEEKVGPEAVILIENILSEELLGHERDSTHDSVV